MCIYGCVCVCRCLCVSCVATHKTCPTPWKAVRDIVCVTLVRSVPKRASKVQLDVPKCHACHAKCSSMSPTATPAAQSEGLCRQAPRLTRKQPRRPQRQTGPKRAIKASPAAPTAPNGTQARHQRQPSAISATPATQSESRCHACHANSRGAHGAKRDSSALPEPAQCHKCHTCHAKCSLMSPSARPATRSEGRCCQDAARCRQVPGLPREVG